MAPTWLEQKMHWHGPAAVVDDFYTALQADEDFVPTGKLLLQAFKMAESTALALPHAGALAAQMLARTQAVSAVGGGVVDENFVDWWRGQARDCDRCSTRQYSCLTSSWLVVGPCACDCFEPPRVHARCMPPATVIAATKNTKQNKFKCAPSLQSDIVTL